MLAELFSIVAPVLVCAGLGFGWAKSGRKFDTDMVMTLVTNIGVPCLVFSTLVQADIEAKALATMAGATAVVVVAVGVLGAAVLKLLRQPVRPFLPSLMFPNVGNMGLPLCLLAFGDIGLALGIAVFTVMVVIQFVVSPIIAGNITSPMELARIPILYAVAASLIVILGHLEPWAWVVNTTKILGGMVIPLMLTTLGISLARLRVVGLARAAGIAVLRVGLGFGIGLAVATGLGLEGAAKGVLVLQSSLPVAVFNFLFAERYQTRPTDVAGAVVVSTLLSFAALPALLWFLL